MQDVMTRKRLVLSANGFPLKGSVVMRIATFAVGSLSTLTMMACSTADPSPAVPAAGGQAGTTVGVGMGGGANTGGVVSPAGGNAPVAGGGAAMGGGGNAAGGSGGSGGSANPGPKPKVLFVSGSNHHNWLVQDPYLINILKSSKIFESVTYEIQPATNDDASWAAWSPTWTDYDVVVHNLSIKYGGGRDWPAGVKASFEAYMANGGAMASIHGGTHGWDNWPEYTQMTGGTWQSSDFGCSWEIKNGVQTMVPQGSGPPAIDTPLTDRLAHVLDPEHPITKGFPLVRKVITDNTSVFQRGPCEGITVIDYALSVGSGADGYFPASWTKLYKGKGRFFHHAPMHVMANSSNEVLHEADDVGFQTLWIRGVEWAATGAVTYPLPANMPTETTESRNNLCPDPCTIME